MFQTFRENSRIPYRIAIKNPTEHYNWVNICYKYRKEALMQEPIIIVLKVRPKTTETLA
jgi:hypothetical protein